MDKQARSMFLAEYARLIEPTDKLPEDDLKPVLMGLFGEVGSIMAAAKKHLREGDAFSGYRHAVIDEFGDVLWYFAALCRRLKLGIDQIFLEAIEVGSYTKALTATDIPDWPLAITSRINSPLALDPALLQLGEAAAALLSLAHNSAAPKSVLILFADNYLKALQAASMTFGKVIEYNLLKTQGRFLPPDLQKLPTFDSAFGEDERIPDYFEITITQRKSGKTYMKWNDVFIGDPLTDNIRDSDGYRFHDVFHFAHASVLHWSPTFRGLIKHKRKSDPQIDEVQDSGRPIVVEEGLTAWIFSRAKEHGFFEKQKSLSFDMLKTIQQFVSGYEVEECPLKLWEDAILQGYGVFLKVRENGGGTIIGDRKNRKVSYSNG